MLSKDGHLQEFIPSILKEDCTRSLRSPRKLLLKESQCKNRKHEKSFMVQSINLWNKLPEYIKTNL